MRNCSQSAMRLCPASLVSQLESRGGPVTDVLSIIAGLALLIAGGELLVRGAVDTAERLGLSTLIISLVLVSLATSAPELVTSVQAALRDSPGIAVGNIVGSNIAN